ncbi:MAG: type II toxin-antitoxin system VapC family toxin [Candidatus Syntrophoarchaeum sp.]|nr:type II toxin-antitoxin system VapC family toxin [Candidatus Syntrophoarchaeum sp.]
MKCIDTTYFVDLIRRPSAIRTITQKLDEGGVHATTVFNVYEALFGAYAIKDEEKRKKVKDKLEKAISRMKVLDFEYTDAVKAAELGGTLAHKGKHVGADAIIAAIAINKGCDAVVTRNEEHFRWIEEISGLKAEIYQF